MPPKAFARIALRRVAVATIAPTAWSKGLWGVFMPDRRCHCQPVAFDRRR